MRILAIVTKAGKKAGSDDGNFPGAKIRDHHLQVCDEAITKAVNAVIRAKPRARGVRASYH